ncbi:MAG TPA: hypothetical protein VIM71_09500 [Lacunisphaera sp.]
MKRKRGPEAPRESSRVLHFFGHAIREIFFGKPHAGCAKIARKNLRWDQPEMRTCVFRGENEAESRTFFRNIKVTKVIRPPRVNNMSES